MRVYPALCALLVAGSVHAETCKYVDDEGRVTYSNVAIKGAKKAMCFDTPAAPPAPASAPRQTKAAPAPSPQNFPSVDRETQKRRDDARRRILEDELAAEEKALAEAQQALKEGEEVRLGGERNYQKYLDRIQGLKDNVALHERNVAALRQELGNVR